MSRQLQGRIACVTGAASGTGRAIALRFALEGAIVVATDVSGEGSQALLHDLRQQGGHAVAQCAARGEALDTERLGHRILGGQARIERGGGVLVNQLHSPPQRAHRGFVQRRDVLLVEGDAPGAERDEA